MLAETVARPPEARDARMAAPTRPVRLLVLTAYPRLAASTRYRIGQYLPALSASGIECRTRAFLTDAAFKRLYAPDGWMTPTRDVLAGAVRSAAVIMKDLVWADVVWIEREAAPLGPPVLEWIATRLLKRSTILDLDDALYARVGEAGGSPVYGEWLSALKCHWKTNRTIHWASHVVAGNTEIANHVRSIRGNRDVTFIPTAIDTKTFCPRTGAAYEGPLTIGWLGSHSASKFLDMLVPVFEELGRRFHFVVVLVGAGRPFKIDGVEVESRGWELEREVRDLQSFDIGVYPLHHTQTGLAKSGFKAIQYMAAGVPFVASPVGIVRDLVDHGREGYLAETQVQWVEYLTRLLADPSSRAAMGRCGREKAVRSFDNSHYVPDIANLVTTLRPATLARTS